MFDLPVVLSIRALEDPSCLDHSWFERPFLVTHCLLGRHDNVLFAAWLLHKCDRLEVKVSEASCLLLRGWAVQLLGPGCLCEVVSHGFVVAQSSGLFHLDVDELASQLAAEVHAHLSFKYNSKN